MAAEVAPLSRCTASAPGKLIFYGEHAVVYGTKAVAASLSDLRIAVDVTGVESVSDEGTLSITAPDLADVDSGIEFTAVFGVGELSEAVLPVVSDVMADSPTEPSDEAKKALVALVKSSATCSSLPEIDSRALIPVIYLAACLAGKQLLAGHSIEIKIQPIDLPPGSGIGSSASLCVATAAALLGATGTTASLADSTHFPDMGAGLRGRMPTKENLDLINGWAFTGEMLIHGHPSGLDNTVSCYGGALSYVKTPKQVEQLADFPTLDVLLTHTHVPKNTGKMVAGVKELKERLPVVIDPMIAAMNGIAERAIEICCMDVDKVDVAAELGELMRINHALLNGIGVGHAALDKVVSIAASYGLAAKLTGSGGGGCAMVLLSQPRGATAVDAAAVEESLSAEGFSTSRSSLGGPGVLWHDPSEAASKFW